MRKKLIILNAILLIGSIINIGAHYSLGNEKKLNLELSELIPQKIGVWESKDIPISDYILKGVGADSQIWKHFYDGKGNTVELWMAYYKDQSKSTAHNPNTCYNGQGWATEKKIDKLEFNDGDSIDMTQIYLTKDNNTNLSYYWYIIAGEMAGTEFKKNLYKFYFGFLKNRRDLLFLRFSINIRGQEIRDQDKIIKNFILSFFPIMKNKLPATFFN